MVRNAGGIEQRVWAGSDDALRTPADTSDNPSPTFTEGWDSRWTGTDGNKPQMEQFNQLFYKLFSLVADLNNHGLLEWDTSVEYLHPALVLHSDTVYVSKQNSTGQDPSTATAYWQSYPPPDDTSTGLTLPSGGSSGDVLFRTATGTEWDQVDRAFGFADVTAFAAMARALY